jgi:hypothetical protein
MGERCAPACTSDAECATRDGYVCDPQWRACLLPNVAIITPRACSKPAGRDLSFSDGVVVPNATTAAARLSPDGRLLAGVPTIANAHDPADCEAAACGEPIVIDRGMTVHVLYASEHGVRVRTSRDGGTTLASGPIALVASSVSALATPDGRLHVVGLYGGPLAGFGSAQYAVEYTASADGGRTFAAPIAISARDEMLPFLFARPALAVDTKRRWIYVAYVRGGRDARWDIVIAASKDGGKTWKRTTVAQDGCAIHMVPALAVDEATGRLHAAYYDSEAAPGRFAHASCGPGVAKCTVHGAINSVPFATLSLTRKPGETIGDVATLLVDDKRRLLHAVWAQRVDEAGTHATRIFHAQGKLKK